MKTYFKLKTKFEAAVKNVSVQNKNKIYCKTL